MSDVLNAPERLAAEVGEAVRADPVAYALVVKAGIDALIELAHGEAAVRAGGNAAALDAALREIEELCQAWIDIDEVEEDATTDQLGWELAAHRRAEMVLAIAREALAVLEPAQICPKCGKPLIDFDRPAPAETGTTCNPISSPDCWKRTDITRATVAAALTHSPEPAPAGGGDPKYVAELEVRVADAEKALQGVRLHVDAISILARSPYPTEHAFAAGMLRIAELAALSGPVEAGVAQNSWRERVAEAEKALEKAAETFEDFDQGLRLLGRFTLANASRIAAEATRAALTSSTPDGSRQAGVDQEETEAAVEVTVRLPDSFLDVVDGQQDGPA